MLETASQRYVVEKIKTRFCCLQTQIREIRFHWLGIHSKLSQRLYSCRLCSTISCSQKQSTSQWTWRSGTSKPNYVFIQLWEGLYPSKADSCRKVLKKDLTNATRINCYTSNLLQMRLMPEKQLYFHFQFNWSTTAFSGVRRKFLWGVSFSDVWWSFLYRVRCLWRHNLTSWSCFQNKVLAKFVDVICIFFYIHCPYFMCHCTEYKLSALQVRLS